MANDDVSQSDGLLVLIENTLEHLLDVMPDDNGRVRASRLLEITPTLWNMSVNLWDEGVLKHFERQILSLSSIARRAPEAVVALDRLEGLLDSAHSKVFAGREALLQKLESWLPSIVTALRRYDGVGEEVAQVLRDMVAGVQAAPLERVPRSGFSALAKMLNPLLKPPVSEWLDQREASAYYRNLVRPESSIFEELRDLNACLTVAGAGADEKHNQSVSLDPASIEQSVSRMSRDEKLALALLQKNKSVSRASSAMYLEVPRFRDILSDIALGAPFQIFRNSETWELTDFGEELGRFLLDKIEIFADRNFADFAAAAKSVREHTPAQQVGPIHFDIVDGTLRIIPQHDLPDRETIEAVSAGRRASEFLGHMVISDPGLSNLDPRLKLVVIEMQEKLEAGADVVELGVLNLAVEQLRKMFEDEIPKGLAGLIDGWSKGIRLLVGNYPVWGNYNDAANARELTPENIAAMVTAAIGAVEDLKKAERVDPEVPRTIALLQALIADPRAAPKRVAFALLRTLENLTARVFTHFGALLEAVPNGAAEGVRTIAKWTVVYTALQVATQLLPISASVPELAWIGAVVEALKAALKAG